MSSTPQLGKPAASPTEMLAAQTQALAQLVEIQTAQKAQIEELQRQNERLIGLLASPEHANPLRGLQHVKVEDFNMPFIALVGILVKISIASIPAFLILGLMSAIIIFILSFFGFALGGIFGR